MNPPDQPPRLQPGKQGFALVAEAVTAAASLLALLGQSKDLDERDRRSCAMVRELLERAELVIYGSQT